MEQKPKKSQEEVLLSWGRDMRRVNLHGALLEQLPDGSVRYENPLLASGIPIRTWSSRIRFSDRAAVLLPFLEEGEVYDVTLCLTCTPAESVFVQFTFFDRSDARIGTALFSRNGSFVCPAGTYYYEISLVQGGAGELVFDHIGIAKRSTP
ncbi:MAG: accessory Sec system protein Asp3 [Firmicutes bacterium]|nr:accessory Sec system protein Asp3 [Bacillota bacterium]